MGRRFAAHKSRNLQDNAHASPATALFRDSSGFAIPPSARLALCTDTSETVAVQVDQRLIYRWPASHWSRATYSQNILGQRVYGFLVRECMAAVLVTGS